MNKTLITFQKFSDGILGLSFPWPYECTWEARSYECTWETRSYECTPKFLCKSIAYISTEHAKSWAAIFML